jgi:hypothetical protein
MTMYRSFRVFVSAAAFALAATTVPSNASASPEAEADAVRLSAAGRTLKWNWTPPGQSKPFGHAEAVIGAPLATVRQVVLDFERYPSFASSRFKVARVLKRDAGNTEVYMQFSVLHGLLKLWHVTRFAPPRAAGAGTEIIEGTFVRGNIKDARTSWTLREVDANTTVLKADILLTPDIPAPQSALDEELRDAAQQAVDGVREKSQGHNRQITWARP